MTSAYGEREEASLRDAFILKQRWETAESRRRERKSERTGSSGSSPELGT